MTPETLDKIANRVAKWRSVFAGWQLGTRAADDPECNAIKDQRELLIMLRAEVNALTRIVVDAALVTPEQFRLRMAEELLHLDKCYENNFPGFKATDYGMQINTEEASKTMKGWPP